MGEGKQRDDDITVRPRGWETLLLIISSQLDSAWVRDLVYFAACRLSIELSKIAIYQLETWQRCPTTL